MASYVPVLLAFNCFEPKEGANDKPPVIFLHGLTVSKENWYDIPQYIADKTGRKTYAIDARNHGDSPWAQATDFDSNVVDLEYFMDHIKAPKAIIVGHSMGGITGMKIALRKPERVEMLIVEDMTIRRPPEKIQQAILHKLALMTDAVDAIPDGVNEKQAQKFIVDYIHNALPPEYKEFSFLNPDRLTLPLKKKENGRFALKANVRVLQVIMRNNAKMTKPPYEGVYNGPTCFIYGKASHFNLGTDEDNIKKFFPKAELVGIDNATHTVHNDFPKEFMEALAIFLLQEKQQSLTNYDPVLLAYNYVEPEGGANDKPPVIFLHGVTASKENWWDIPQKIADKTGRKAYVVDARNHGDSPWTQATDFDCNVVDLEYFMDHIKAPKVVIVGHSMGGITGMKTALRKPGRVEKLVVEDMTLRRPPMKMQQTIQHKLAVVKEAVDAIPDGMDEKQAQKFLIDYIHNALPQEYRELSFLHPYRFPMPLKRKENGRFALKANIDVLQVILRNNAKMTKPPYEGIYEGPNCFLYGKASLMHVDTDEDNIKKFFPNAKLVGIDNATHTVHNDFPKEFTEALANFLFKE